jgi:ABC-type sugar transport system ATPase subunit
MIEFDAVSKSFAGVPVLKAVSFTLTPGHTLGLVGENGAGKSTLMNILGGNLEPDAGRMLLDGQPYAPRHPQEAARHGISFIHQELNLFPNLSIAENIFLTVFPRTGRLPIIDRRTLRQQTAELLGQVGVQHSPDTPVERLSAGERQLVEIAKAISIDARLIILDLDEPTRGIDVGAKFEIYQLIHELADQGAGVLLISSEIEELIGVCDRILVMSRGEIRDELSRPEFDRKRILAAALGGRRTV